MKVGRSARSMGTGGSILAALVVLAACGESKSTDSPVARGKMVYKAICTTCHAADPSEDGVLGPAIAGSSVELIEAKMLRGDYPPGYTPKRPTTTMPPLPHLEENIPDLAAYLAQPTS